MTAKDMFKVYTLRVPCHYPGCKKLSKPTSNYCATHGKKMKEQYERGAK